MKSLDEKTAVTKSGRKFKSYHQKLPDNMPPDLVRETAKRELEKIGQEEKKKNR
jgi:hypothetical protein